MSQLENTETSGKIKDVYFAYVKIKKPVKKYQSDQTEFCTSVVVDKTTAKALKKLFTKISLKEIDNEDFEHAYKFPPPFKDQDEQFVFTLRADSHYKDGNPKEYQFNTRPKVYAPNGDKVEDITLTTNVGNGSFGDLAFLIKKRDTGTFSSLLGILVKDLVELENQKEGFTPFGEVIHNESGDLEESPF